MAFDAQKFRVVHHERGPMSRDEVFVLVPKRDPAAVVALRAYAAATGDAALAGYLTAWMDQLELEAGLPVDVAPRGNVVGFLTQVAIWTSTLARAVREDGMELETALQRIAGFAWSRRNRLEVERATRGR